MANTVARQYYIDWIRVLAFLLLILFHCSMPFVRFGWEIKNTDHSVFLDRVIIWLHQWRLPLLFFISGVGVSFSLKKRSVVGFMGERFVRLFIPLLFAMFFTIPLQPYFEWLQTGKIHMSYAEFYPSVWKMIPYPEGTLTWSHMWFVVYLFTFTILLLPLFALFKIAWLQKLKQKANAIVQSPFLLLLFAFPFIYQYFALYIRWPEQGSLLDDWFVFDSSITYYLMGYLLADLPAFWDCTEKYRKYFLSLALVCIALLFWKYFWPVTLPKKQDSSLYLFGVLDGLQIWLLILTIIGYAKHHLNYSNKWLRYLTPAVYPFYILHQTLIVAMGYYITQWHASIFIKLMALIVLCFLGILGIYHLLIRPFKLTRILYGLKPRKTKNELNETI